MPIFVEKETIKTLLLYEQPSFSHTSQSTVAEFISLSFQCCLSPYKNYSVQYHDIKVLDQFNQSFIHIYTHICMYVCVYVYVHVHVYVCICVCSHSLVRVHFFFFSFRHFLKPHSFIVYLKTNSFKLHGLIVCPH